MRLLLLLLTGCLLQLPGFARADEALPSWNPGAVRDALIAFVEGASAPGSDDFIPEAERIAVFDNDGTLWAEQPAYFQLLFAMDRIRALAPEHPEWRENAPFRAVIENDMKALAATGEHELLEVVMAAQSGMSSTQFAGIVQAWIDSARHPTTGRRYTEMVYQPMQELLTYLRAHGFRTYIVSGGGVDFMRPWTESVYGIPPEQVVGSSSELRFEITEDGPRLLREPALHHVNDKAGKPVGIQRFIGRRPVFAAGNSDGDLEMLQWTTAGEGRAFGLLVHHTDGEREWAYDRASAIGRLDRALDEAGPRGWTVVDMARDWRRVYPAIPAEH
ncbi:MAG: HAD family hydrolase [Halieaceae bacterium]|jgi:phosphoglycolate phosphatase-like HAD superfamily hydrolase|nr:HAD family hydrolase [Halieaceae bacterium]